MPADAATEVEHMLHSARRQHRHRRGYRRGTNQSARPSGVAHRSSHASSAVAAICVEQDDPLTFSAESCALTESDIKSIDPTNSCDLAFAGTPISCGGKPDCCSSYCTAATNVSPAVCL